MVEFVWIAALPAFAVAGFLFATDPISFGLTSCSIAIRVVSLGLKRVARDEWHDEWMGQLELDVFDQIKRRNDMAIGRILVIQAVIILVTGWEERWHYGQARSDLEAGDAAGETNANILRAYKELLVKALSGGARWAEEAEFRTLARVMLTLVGLTMFLTVTLAVISVRQPQQIASVVGLVVFMVIFLLAVLRWAFVRELWRRR